jgi:type III pantothenate kinase
MSSDPNLLAISVGNTRTQVGRFGSDGLEAVERFPNTMPGPVVDLVCSWWKEVGSHPQASILLASVNESFAATVSREIEDQLNVEVYRVGDDVPVPIGTQLDPETITGVDRLLNAAAAFDRIKQACVVVDAGTAITVDFVDGEGTFHGGAIAPGASMQLRALHQQTAALPEITFQAPDDDAFGRNTTQAMLQGVYHGVRGMVQRLVERYAASYGAFPMVIATGGDAAVLFENEELVDRVVPDLTLLGIAISAKHALAIRANGGEGADADGPQNGHEG